MARVLIWAVIGLVIWWWVRRLAAPADPPRRAPPGRDDGKALQDMVRCGRCGVFLPRTEALPGPDGQAYCCPEHRPADRRA